MFGVMCKALNVPKSVNFMTFTPSVERVDVPYVCDPPILVEVYQKESTSVSLLILNIVDDSFEYENYMLSDNVECLEIVPNLSSVKHDLP